MTDDMKNNIGQLGAWLAAFMGTLTFEMWLGVAGLAVSIFIALTNRRSRKLQDRLLLEEAERSAQLHELEMLRLKAGLNILPATTPTMVHDMVAGQATAGSTP